jgi:hypothetical protein
MSCAVAFGAGMVTYPSSKTEMDVEKEPNPKRTTEPSDVTDLLEKCYAFKTSACMHCRRPGCDANQDGVPSGMI